MLDDIGRDLDMVVNDAVRLKFPEHVYHRDEIAGELALSWLQASPGGSGQIGLGLTHGTATEDAKKVLGLRYMWQTLRAS